MAAPLVVVEYDCRWERMRLHASVLIVLLCVALMPLIWFVYVIGGVISLIVFLVAVGAALILIAQERRRERTRLLCDAAATGPVDFAAALRALLPEFVNQNVSKCFRDVLCTLQRRSPSAGAALIAPPEQVFSVTPLEMPFEPLALEEGSVAFQQLWASDDPDRKLPREIADPRVRPLMPLAVRVNFRRLERPLIWALILLVALRRIWVSVSVDWPLLSFVAAVIIFSLWCVATAARDSTLLVPGAIVIRQPNPRRRGENSIRLFTRENCLLAVVFRGKNRWNWHVCDSTGGHATDDCSSAEAELLLRAWFSPLAPPSVDRLGDLT